MLTPFVRLLILACCTLLSIAAAYHNIWSLLIFSSLISFVVLFGYFRSSTIQLALKALMAEDYTKLDAMLSYIKHPERLTTKNKLRYLFCQGMLARENDDTSKAIATLEDVTQERLHPDQYQALALLALTDMYMVQGRKDKAKYHFQKLKNLKVHKDTLEAVRKMQSWLEIS